MGCTHAKPAATAANGEPEATIKLNVRTSNPQAPSETALQATQASSMGLPGAAAAPAAAPVPLVPCVKQCKDGLLEQRLEPIKNTVCTAMDTPICLVGLVDNTYIWYLNSQSALFRPCLDVTGSFCSTLRSEVLAATAAGSTDAVSLFVPDATADERFASHPAVCARPHMTLYAGVPLLTDTGHCLGTFSTADYQPRSLDAKLIEKLPTLAAEAVAEIEREMMEALRRGVGAAPGQSPPKPAVIVDVRDAAWNAVLTNASWDCIIGVSPADFQGETLCLWDLMQARDPREKATIVAGVAARHPQVPAFLAPLGDTGALQQYMMVLFEATPEAMARHAPDVAWTPPSDAPAGSFYCGVVHAVMADFEGAAAAAAHSKTLSSSGGSTNTAGDGVRISGGSNVSVLAGPGMDPSKIPTRFAGLELGAFIASGGYGKVFEGLMLGKPVAVKVVEIPVDDEAPSRTWETSLEAILGLTVSHPNVVPTLDFYMLPHAGQTHCSPGTGAAASQAWIIQQLCTRGTLSHALEHGGLNAYDNTPDVKLILELAAEVASALKYLHSKSMLHGDLNASNVMLHDDPHLTRGFKAMVTDFGLVRMCRASRNTASLGTVSHMPPELLRDGILSAKTDVYSFGVLLIELWTGKKAWGGHSPARIIYLVACGGKHLEMPEDSPTDVKALVDSCLSQNPSDRPDFAAVLDTLQAMLAARATST